jgi:hypothetical protein
MTWTKIPYTAPISNNYIVDKINQERELIDWCQHQFPNGGWVIHAHMAEFKRKEDAMLFALRWS